MSDLHTSPVTRVSQDWIARSELRSVADVYIQTLRDKRYSRPTIEQYGNAFAHFARWMTRRGLHVCDIDESMIHQFVHRHLPVCRCAQRCQRTSYTSRAALKQLLKTLRGRGLIAAKIPTEPPAIAEELRQFEHYMTEVCGLAQVTRYYSRLRVRAFLLDQFGRGPIRFRDLRRSDISRFIMAYAAHWKPASRDVIGDAIRCYLRFKAISGESITSLLAALPHAARWRLAVLPKTLTSAEITQLLTAFNRDSAIGKRDYAIARCFIDLGLRNIEVTRLQLQDLEWRQGTVCIHGKGRRVDVLPLPQATGRALADYLQHGRPRTILRNVFIRHRSPFDIALSPNTTRNAIRYAARRSGLNDRIGGTHIFRYTMAKRLVNRGASLKEIADLLCHRSLDTTTIYAKINEVALARVAMPWAGRVS